MDGEHASDTGTCNNATIENEFRRLAANRRRHIHVARVYRPSGVIATQWEVDFGKGCLEAAVRVAFR